jgi:hypothetical protein
VTSCNEITAADAQQLWGELRQHFANAENVIQQIVAQKAWEPLGYGSFAEAWAAEMSNLSLPAEVRPHVVYQMLAEGWEPIDVAAAVKGVGPQTAAALARQRRNGVPPNHAVVREHYRRPAAPPSHIRISVGTTMLGEYHRIALVVGQSVEEIALEAVRERFRELAAGKPRKKAAS